MTNVRGTIACVIRQGVHSPRSLIDAARELRDRKTQAEHALWAFLRGRSLMNLKFRRQHQIDRYIVDFYCIELRLAIELDGAGHFEQSVQELDSARTHYLQKRGVTVVRFENEDVLQNGWFVAQKIRDIANELQRLRASE